MGIRAILYDLDGVLVDACEWHYEALNRALQRIVGIEIGREEHLTTFNGFPTKKKLQFLVDLGRIPADQVSAIEALKQSLTVRMINELARPDPIKVELHEFVTRDVGIPIGCVTNSIRSTAKQMLDRTGQLKYMSLLVSNEDVRFPKPKAEGYIQSMVRLSSPPSQTLIIEDSDTGIKAAMDSCANVVRVSGAAEVTRESVSRYLREFDR